MKSILGKFAVAAAVVAMAATSAMAETRLNVPFNFTVGDKICPAGTYAVEKRPLDGFVTLKSKDGATHFSWALGPGEPSPSDSRVVLKFDELNGEHSLRAVQYGPMTTFNASKKAKHMEHMQMETVHGQGQ